LIEVNFSIGIKRTLQQYEKSNSAKQDDEQHNVGLNDEITTNTKKNKKKNLINVEITYLS
jgi:hypothetical protein